MGPGAGGVAAAPGSRGARGNVGRRPAAEGGWGHYAAGLGIAGAANASAAFCTNSIDVVKVHAQLDTGEGASLGLRARTALIVRNEGIPPLFLRGLPCSLAREGVYSSIRMGINEPVKAALGSSGLWPYEEGAAATKVAASVLSGAIGAFVGSPFELLKVRMQSDGWKAPPDGSIVACVRRLVAEEGWAGLWRGQAAFVQRSALLTGAQMPAYELSKGVLTSRAGLSEGLPLHFTASMVAGFAATAVCSPMDFAKTRVMQGGSGSVIRELTEAVRREGPLAPYKGFTANWLRIGPHTIVCFLAYERLRAAFGWEPLR